MEVSEGRPSLYVQVSLKPFDPKLMGPVPETNLCLYGTFQAVTQFLETDEALVVLSDCGLGRR